MKKHYLFLLLAMACFSGKSFSQGGHACGTDEMLKTHKQQDPKIAIYEQQLEQFTQNYIHSKNLVRRSARTTASTTTDTGYYEIPVVVHVIHNYGVEVLADNAIYKLIDEMNAFYDMKNNVTNVIQPFKKYIGKARIRFHLASIDPNGNPTNGITHRHSYTTYGYDDQAKMDQWPQQSYFNIWFEEHIGLQITGGTVLAYATPPGSSVGQPFYDGVIAGYEWIDDGGTDGGSTLDHETGHFFNLAHPWNSSGKGVEGACGDDGVDDTPPTKGHFSCGIPLKLYDTACAINYYKIYPDTAGNDSLENYPDTTNTQNVMDYSGDCTNMFTKGQVVRMHAALNSAVAYRNNLWDSTNLAITGVGHYNSHTQVFTPFPRKDLKPYPEFWPVLTPATGPIVKGNYMDRNMFFTFPNTDVKFINETWNDTVSSLTWTFSNSALITTTTQAIPVMGSTSVINRFDLPGWVTLSMKATGNGASGDTTATWNRALFVADKDATNGVGYFQEFSGADTAKWPMFNYYNNNLHWKMANVGYWDNNSVEYVGYDDRTLSLTGNPRGDYDDLFSIPMDLSSPYGSGPCSMNFYYSAASRSSNSNDINDTLLIQYSVNKSNAWTTLATLSKGTLCNKGTVSFPYTPSSYNDWTLFSMDVPTAARQPYVVFRFRYRPGTALMPGFDASGNPTLLPGYQSSGNNFYMDRITFSPYPAGFDNLNLGNVDVAVMPNPTSGNAYLIIKDIDHGAAAVTVSDITGKVVYTTSQQLSGSQTTVEIPRTAISVSGMYLVHVATGNQSRTVKLVVQ